MQEMKRVDFWNQTSLLNPNLPHNDANFNNSSNNNFIIIIYLINNYLINKYTIINTIKYRNTEILL